MAKKYILDNTTLSAFTPKVKEVLNHKSVWGSIVICSVAISLVLLSSYIDDKSSELYLGVTIVTIILFLYGFYRLLYKRTHLVYQSTGSIIVSGSLYFDKIELINLKEAFTENSKNEVNKLTFNDTGNARLDYYVSTDEKFVAVQVFEFIPYKFESASDIICYSEEEARTIAQLLLRNHRNR